MEQLICAHNVRALIVAASPRTLVQLRHAFHPDVQNHIIAEIDKALSKHPICEIERHIFG